MPVRHNRAVRLMSLSAGPLVVAVMCLLFVGCVAGGSGPKGVAAASRESDATTQSVDRDKNAATTDMLLEEILSKDSEPGTLVIYAGRSETLVAPVIEQFADATGIDVQVKYGGSSAVAATLLEEGHNSQADIFWSQEPGALAALSPMFKQLPPDITGAVPAWASASDGSWVGITARARVLVYTADIDELEVPRSIEELIDSRWKGRVAWAPPSSSLRVMVTAMRRLWGEEKTGAWLTGMLANDVQVYPKNTAIVDAIGRGEVDIGLVNHYYLHRFLAERGDDFGARNLFLKDGGPASLVMVAGTGIVKTGTNPENAELFVRFLLSEVAQKYFAASVYEYPLVEGVATHRLLPPIETLNGPEIEFALLDDLAGTEALMREVGLIP